MRDIVVYGFAAAEVPAPAALTLTWVMEMSGRRGGWPPVLGEAPEALAQA